MKRVRWIVATALLSACAPKQAPVGAQVRSITFEHNGPPFSARGDRALRQAIAHPKPKGIWPFVKEVPLDESVLDTDERRIYVHYADRGWFDAELVRWRIEEVTPGKDVYPPVVRIVGEIEEGEQSLVREVEWEGLDGLPGKLVRALKSGASVEVGDPFDLDAHHATLDGARQLLHEHAYAHAEVDGTVLVREDGSVRLTYAVAPGPVAEFGEVTIEGAPDVPRALVAEKLEVEPGAAYRGSDLQQTQQNLYGMGAFSVVDVEPQLEASGDVVPVHIRLEEREPRSVGLGVGLEAQSGRQQLLGQARFGHANALHRLVTVDLEATAGYATLAETWDPTNPLRDVRGGPVVDSALKIGVPRVPAPRWRGELELGFDREVAETYQLVRPSLTPSLTGPLAEHLGLTLAYTLHYTRYVDLRVDPSRLASLEGAPDLADGDFLGAYLEQALVWDTRDDPMSPTKGFRNALTLRQAGTWLGGEYDYLGAELDLRGYLGFPREWPQWTENVVLAGRVGSGVREPYGPPDRRAVPISERLYLGGSGSVRGWIYQHLGPTICVDEDGVECVGPSPDSEILPIGGQVASWGSAEIRRNWESFGLVAFADAGMVWATADDAWRTPILPSLGLGGRVQTPVGPFRLDVAARTDRQERFADEPRVWLHIGLGEAF